MGRMHQKNHTICIWLCQKTPKQPCYKNQQSVIVQFVTMKAQDVTHTKTYLQAWTGTTACLFINSIKIQLSHEN